MPSTRAERIFDELKRFLSPGRIWLNVLVPQHDLLKSFSAPTTKLNIAQKVFMALLQLLNIFRTPDIEQKKPPKSFTVIPNHNLYVLRWSRMSHTIQRFLKIY